MPPTPTIKHKRRRERDLTKAICLRPLDVFNLYGIPPATLRDFCIRPNPADRLPSILIQGRNGRKGIRLINHAVLRAYLEKRSTTRKVA